MANYSIHAGHNANVPGAQGYIREEVIDRQIKDATIKYLRAADQTVYDDTDEQGKTQDENLSSIVRKINAHSGLALAVSIHLNAGGGAGIEVYQYDSKTDTVAARVLNKICAVTRLRNRGQKKNQSLYVLRHSKPPAILIECGFVDTKTGAEIVIAKTDVIGKAIAEGILGKDINKENQSSQPSKSASVKPVPSRNPPNRSDILFKKNDKGSAVRTLQQDLIKAGYSVGKSGADGVFGPATENAVRVLQKDYKLSEDGIVGVETRAALSKALEKKKKQPKPPDSAVAPYHETLIKRGSSGKSVERIQRALSIHVDGIFGAKTEAAVKAYQKRHNLTADGIVGPQTWNTMF